LARVGGIIKRKGNFYLLDRRDTTKNPPGKRKMEKGEGGIRIVGNMARGPRQAAPGILT